MLELIGAGSRCSAARLASAVFLVLLAWTSGAAAQSYEAAPPEPPPPELPIVSLSVAPLSLIFPIFSLTAEVRAGDYCGVAAFGGVGSVTVGTSNDDDVRFSVWHAGGQVLAYPLEPFESLQLGVELEYAHVAIDDDVGTTRVDGIGSGLFVGPLVGYKLITDIGFTLIVQGGVGFGVVQVDVEDEDGDMASVDSERVLPILNFNLGWSF